MSDTKALRCKLLVFAGFKPVDNEFNWWQEESCISGKRTLTRDTLSFPYHSMPRLDCSLDAQQKFLWPRLRDLGFMIRYQYSQLRDNDTGKLLYDWAYHCWIYDISYSNKRAFHNYEFPYSSKESPAMACALAVQNLIEHLEKEAPDGH